MSRWEKRRHPLPENHSWKAAEGYNIFVADRGALRLDFPDGWIVKPDRASICFHDREPPDDRCCMEVSYLRLQPIDWSGLPVPELLKSVCHGEGRTGCGEIVQAMRPDLELAWTEYSTLDPAEQRPATHRVCVARSANVVLPRPGRKPGRVLTRPLIQALITAAFWPEDAAWVQPVWAEMLRSLQLGIMLASPAGPRCQ